ncbi:MAG: MFS transporter [Gemmatimonadaceae bacterium]
MTPLRLVLVNVFIRIGSAASGQLFAFLLADRMASRAGAGSLVAAAIGLAFYATELVGAPIAGHIADTHGQRRVLRWGPWFGIGSMLLGAAAALRVTSVTVLIGILLAARFAEGLSAACAVPTSLVLLSQATDGDAARSVRLRLMGLFEIASLGGIIVGYLLAGTLWDAIGGNTFLMLPLVYLAALVFTGGTDRSVPTPRRRAKTWTALRYLVQEQGARGFAMAWLAVNAVVGVWLQQAPYLLKLPVRSSTQSLVGGFEARTIGIVFAVWGMTFLVGIALWSWLAPRWPRRRTLFVALGGMLGVVVSLAMVNHGGPWWILALAAIAVIVESGFTPAAFAHLADLTDAHAESRGGAMGLYSLLLGLGQLMGAGLGAPFAARWQMDGVLAVTAVLAAVALVGVRRMSSGPLSPSAQTSGAGGR